MLEFPVYKYEAIVISFSGVHRKTIYRSASDMYYGTLAITFDGVPKYDLGGFSMDGGYNVIGRYIHLHNFSQYSLGQDLVSKLGDKYAVMDDSKGYFVLHYGKSIEELHLLEDFPIELFKEVYPDAV